MNFPTKLDKVKGVVNWKDASVGSMVIEDRDIRKEFNRIYAQGHISKHE